MRILITLIEKIIYNQVLYPSNTFNDLISSADEIIIFWQECQWKNYLLVSLVVTNNA